MQPLPSTDAILTAYDGWIAQQATRMTSDLKFEGDAYRDARVVGDNTYSRSDVAAILTGQVQALCGAALKAQDSFALSSRSLLKGILAENDRQRVPVSVDAAAFLNQGNALSAIEVAEQKALASKGSMRLGALPPVNSAEAQAKQLAEAHEEIRRLNERMRAMAAQFESAMRDKSTAQENMLTMQDTVAGMEKDVANMTQQQQQAMQRQNAEFRAEINKLRAQVLDAQKELTGKLSQSTQFVTLKRMLNEKNDLCKSLRASLARYDPTAAAAAGDDDIEAVDDDD